MRLVLLRGIPGAGKSTYAKTLDGAVVVSPDQIMARDPGGYRWSVPRWREAVTQADQELVGALSKRHALVVSDRCNLTTQAFGAVVGFARALGYTVEIHQLNVDELTAAARNVHGVGLGKIGEQWRRMDGTRLPEDIPVRVVSVD